MIPFLGGRVLTHLRKYMSKNINVRFDVFSIKDRVFRYYRGPRKTDDLISFVDDKKYEGVEPISSWKNPDSYV